MIATKELPQFVRDLLSSPPARGEGLNNWFYRVARVLHPYRSDEEINLLLQAATAGERVKPGEIVRAVEHSRATAWRPGQVAVETVAKWPSVNQEQRAAILRDGGGLVDLWEWSPVRLNDNEAHSEEIIDRLFPGNPLLCVGKSNSEFATRARKQWRGRLNGLPLIVPSPMLARAGATQEGKQSEHALQNTGPRKFLVIEFDHGTADEHAAVLLHLAERGPLALALHSGGKSLHGWFHCAGQSEEKLRRFMCFAVSLGADRATWTRSQFVRMPDGTRANGNRQTVYFFNPEVVQ
ncbi:MAG: hypothetical protein H0V54_07015 [Chthoniobacterales bacterium]|nr:hypothetical protein [Chthoniobacterales bacterium]